MVRHGPSRRTLNCRQKVACSPPQDLTLVSNQQCSEAANKNSSASSAQSRISLSPPFPLTHKAVQGRVSQTSVHGSSVEINWPSLLSLKQTHIQLPHSLMLTDYAKVAFSGSLPIGIDPREQKLLSVRFATVHSRVPDACTNASSMLRRV